jgi:hypothetical protein
MKNLYDATINFKQDSHHRIINGIEITEARGAMMYPDVHFLEGKIVTVGAMRVTTQDPRHYDNTPSYNMRMCRGREKGQAKGRERSTWKISHRLRWVHFYL